MSDDRKLIPLYDATAPIVCTLTAGEVQERRELLGWLRANVSAVGRTEHGMLLHFPAEEDVGEQLRHFARVEKQCCAFWGFAVQREGSQTTLRWDAPPAAGELVERLLAYLGGDEDADIADLL